MTPFFQCRMLKENRRYFVDLLVTFKNVKNEIKDFLIEIKCYNEACEPKKQARK